MRESSAWNRYINWYKSKFGIKPDKRAIITIKTHGIEARYHILIGAIFSKVTEIDDLYFEKYLESIYHEWLIAKKEINMFPKWLGSPIMIKNFLDNCKIVIRRESDLYSSHTSVGKSKDSKFDPGEMFNE